MKTLFLEFTAETVIKLPCFSIDKIIHSPLNFVGVLSQSCGKQLCHNIIIISYHLQEGVGKFSVYQETLKRLKNYCLVKPWEVAFFYLFLTLLHCIIKWQVNIKSLKTKNKIKIRNKQNLKKKSFNIWYSLSTDFYY